MQAAQVEYSPRWFDIPEFGKFSYDGGGFTTKASPNESTAINLRQQIINQLLPDLGVTGEQRAGQIKTLSDTFTKRILDKALPTMTGAYTSRGLEGSTAERRGLTETINDAVQRGLFAGEDLKIQDEASKISRLGSAESGLQNAFNRLLGISQQGNALNDQYFNVMNQNAGRQQQANLANYQTALKDYYANQDSGGIGDLFGLAGGGFSDLLDVIGLGGGGGGDLFSNIFGTAEKAAGGTLDKISTTSGEGYRKDTNNNYIQSSNSKKSGGGFGDILKDPKTWQTAVQLGSLLFV